ncbi:MAG: diguanylate cyclase/phosphodiesterase with extracellular sensor [Caulobacteraceae bacterium]|nr:diguanylate cyclase/phosphodiesterase with extracellular sensor [Caulobacteraceae bacterium]
MRFNHLRTKLTVLYTALFGAILVCVALVGYSSISHNARQAIHRQLTTTAAVFDSLTQARVQQLHDSASVAGKDAGFRSAATSGDEATIDSALANLKGRLKVDEAFFVQADGKVYAGGQQIDSTGLWEALDSTGAGGATGVMRIGGQPYQAISEPVYTPVLAGWLVFGTRLDRAVAEGSDQKLSAMQFKTSILSQIRGRWTDPKGEISSGEARALDQQVKHAIASGKNESIELNDWIDLIRPLPSLGEGQPPAPLLLRFPVAQAMAPYHSLYEAVLGAGLLGVVLLILGSMLIARGVTRPIHALEDAARRLAQGEKATVAIHTRDEIGRLATSFNAMAGEIAQRETKITYLAMHDPHSGLINRLALERQVQSLIADGADVVIGALAVDRFAQVRGAIGYELADQLMAQLAKALTPCCDAEVARLSDDMLGLVFDLRSGDVSGRAERAIRAAEANIRLGEAAIDVNATLGMAAFGRHGATIEELIERASIALGQARTGRLKAQFFDAAAYGDPASNLSLMSEMLAGLERGDLKLFYQPKYDLRSGQVTGLEALCRWQHPLRGPLSPDLFIPMAEETGAIRPLTDWTLRRAIDDQKALKAAGHEVMVSVNISGRLIGDPDFAEFALGLVRQADGKLCFEITETAVIDNPQAALDAMGRLRDQGIAISIDDYGSGLSSLAYLRRIPAHELKIDKAFVLGLGETSREGLLVRSTIDLAHSLGLKVTAEGVETEVALGLLAAMGCDLAQGYYIARPMPLDQMIDFLSRETPVAAPAPKALEARLA